MKGLAGRTALLGQTPGTARHFQQESLRAEDAGKGADADRVEPQAPEAGRIIAAYADFIGNAARKSFIPPPPCHAAGT